MLQHFNNGTSNGLVCRCIINNPCDLGCICVIANRPIHEIDHSGLGSVYGIFDQSTVRLDIGGAAFHQVLDTTGFAVEPVMGLPIAGTTIYRKICAYAVLCNQKPCKMICHGFYDLKVRRFFGIFPFPGCEYLFRQISRS